MTKTIRGGDAARILALLATALVLAVVAGCATLGLQGPKTFNERLAYGYATVSAVAQGTLTLYTAGKMSKAQAASTASKLEASKVALDAARVGFAVDPAGATARLDATIVALQALQAYLVAKEGGAP